MRPCSCSDVGCTPPLRLFAQGVEHELRCGARAAWLPGTAPLLLLLRNCFSLSDSISLPSPCSKESTELYEGARSSVAAFINAPRVEEVVYTRNATEGAQGRAAQTALCVLAAGLCFAEEETCMFDAVRARPRGSAAGPSQPELLVSCRAQHRGARLGHAPPARGRRGASALPPSTASQRRGALAPGFSCSPLALPAVELTLLTHFTRAFPGPRPRPCRS